MGTFSYLAEKIRDTPIIASPFEHVTTENFLSEAHFQNIVTSRQVQIPQQTNHRELLNILTEYGYAPQEFPGCIVDMEEYINYADGKARFNRQNIKGYGRDVIEGYGITMRLNEYEDKFLAELVNYLNEKEFQKAIKDKFSIDEHVNIETAIQKNLNHYEISPHCDTSRKALTYMVNIYTDSRCEDLSIHTHLLEFKPQYHYLYDVWKYNRYIDPVWVPWSWCETRKLTSKNNSVTIFRPSFDTLHAVKLDYDHLGFQRNQIYGNLWYDEPKAKRSVAWRELDLVGEKKKADGSTPTNELVHHLKGTLRAVKRLVLN